MTEPLWKPGKARIEASAVSALVAHLNRQKGLSLSGYDALHDWSVSNPQDFWQTYWDYAGVKASQRGDRVIVDADKMPGAQFFPDARLNFAENLLVRNDETPALVFRSEDKLRRSVTWAELNGAVSRISQALAASGVVAGDRVCAVMPNCPETIMVFLAVSALGAVWSSCSPDFGERGILDRFGQIEPKVLLACDAYFYNGKQHDVSAKIGAVLAKLPSVETVIIADYAGSGDDVAAGLEKAVTLDAFMAPCEPAPIEYAQLPFSHPLYILFSSGTTGIPKCIVHSAGGVLLKHRSEQQIHCELKENDRLFYFTTCGWMMWNWLVTGLAAGATLLLYDGSPFYPDEKVIFDYVNDEAATIFGTSAKFIDAVRKTGWRPRDTHQLASVQSIMSTGSPLAPESFNFVYEDIKSDVHLASVSGGTDLCGCFIGGVSTLAVYRGEIQRPCIGIAMDVFDDDGNPMTSGKGELVCTAPFPSMPIGFWNDPSGEKYFGAYFDRFENIWCHGDFAEWTENGGMVIHGRSDATLNPGGVRIGTAEIYAQVEQMPEILEGLAIGQQWDDDTRVVLFVRLADGVELDEALEKDIRARIRAGASPRHVPARIVAVADIPRTKSGKITELAVRDIVHGREVKNQEALANPEALALFRDLPQLLS